ncbi:MAG TPA: DUF1552 domain-containing protein [Polyangia bacterium]|nr:DUF1552 domain-containing protein [Polyangia bacterium]
MKLSHRRGLGRRDLMKWLGGAALALPGGLELFERQARAEVGGATKARFAVFCYTPDGVNQSAFWPTGTETNFQLSPILAPFETFKDKMLVLGPQMTGTTPKSGTGLTYCLCGGTTGADKTPPQHQALITLTARARGTSGDIPYLGDQTKAVNRLDGPSIDTVIGEAVQGTSAFPYLNFGLHPIGGDTPSDINFAKDGSPLKRMASPDEAWSRVFGMPVMGGTGGAPNTSDLHRQTALSNYLHGRFSELSPQLSTYDRHIIDGHLTSLRTYEDRKAKLLMGTGNVCMPPGKAMDVPTDDTSIRTGADTEKLSPFFMDIISAAFSCNLAKVASVTFGYPGGGDAGGLRMPWLGFTEAMHAISHHGGNPATLDKYKKMSTWIAGQIAYLMQKLAAIPDAATGKTLLDSTVIYWFNRHGDGNAHSNTNLPNIILGGTGGYFKMGRFLQLPSTNPTKVLISLANSMGVDVPTFGKDAWVDTAPLTGLTA